MKITTEPYRPASRPEPAAKPAAAKAEEKATQTGKPATDVVELTGKKPATQETNTYTPPKKLTQEQVRGIREMLAAQQAQMLQSMAGNTTNQANSFLRSIGGANNGKQEANAFWKKPVAGLPGSELPPAATTPEGALAAISPGGAYSVDAVADRIFNMAASIAGDDPEMLEKMRNAVIKGFKDAGVEFKQTTGKGLPDISNQTYDEIMKRFNEKAAELNGKS